jgi:guanylate kinase
MAGIAQRGTESADAVEKRLAVARAEMDYGASGEFCHTVINDDLDQAYHDLHHILEPLLPKD